MCVPRLSQSLLCFKDTRKRGSSSSISQLFHHASCTLWDWKIEQNRLFLAFSAVLKPESVRVTEFKTDWKNRTPTMPNLSATAEKLCAVLMFKNYLILMSPIPQFWKKTQTKHIPFEVSPNDLTWVPQNIEQVNWFFSFELSLAINIWGVWCLPRSLQIPQIK